MIKGHTDPYFFRNHIKKHIIALKTGSIGKSIVDFTSSQGIEVHKEENLPAHVHGKYVPRTFSKDKIIYEKKLNALILGHEGRHAWQYRSLPSKLREPSSGHGQIIFDRFIEADARAVHLGAVFQMAASMNVKNCYVRDVLKSLSEHEREIYGHDPNNISKIADSPEKLKQAMRKSFDAYIRLGIASEYDEQTSRKIDSAKKSKLSRAFFISVLGGNAFVPCHTQDKMDENYPSALAEHLGRLDQGWQGNYLLDTDGPEINSAFYTRVCNYRLERQIPKSVI